MNTTVASPEVIQIGIFDLQVCVPTDWSDEDVVEWVNQRESLGRTTWHIRREDDPALRSDPERQPCADRVGMVHIMLDA